MLESIYTVHPDAVTAAIKGLTWALGLSATAVVAVGGVLIKVLVYMWNKWDERIDGIEASVKSIAHSLTELQRTNAVEIAEIKQKCQDREKHTDCNFEQLFKHINGGA